MDIPKPDFTPSGVTDGTKVFWEYRNGSNAILRLTAGFIGKAIGKKDTTELEDKENFFALLDKEVSNHSWLSINRTLLTEMLLGRLTDNFLTYLSELLNFIFSEKPEMVLSEKGSLDIKRIFEADSLEELRNEIIEEKVNQLSYKSVTALAEYLKDKLGFSVFEDKTEEGIVIKTIEARNIIVHNRSKINARYNSRVGSPNDEVGERLEVYFSDIVRLNGYFDELTKKIDSKAVKKFKLVTQESGEHPA